MLHEVCLDQSALQCATGVPSEWPCDCHTTDPFVRVGPHSYGEEHRRALSCAGGGGGQVVGGLLDAEAPDEFINNLILSVRSLIPVEQLCAEVPPVPTSAGFCKHSILVALLSGFACPHMVKRLLCLTRISSSLSYESCARQALHCCRLCCLFSPGEPRMPLCMPMMKRVQLKLPKPFLSFAEFLCLQVLGHTC